MSKKMIIKIMVFYISLKTMVAMVAILESSSMESLFVLFDMILRKLIRMAGVIFR